MESLVSSSCCSDDSSNSVSVTRNSSVRVIGCIFTGLGKYGDFSYMIQQPEFSDTLFVFNDNEEQFCSYMNGDRTGIACTRGGGNAIIRPYQCLTIPRAVGIPTGVAGKGYEQLDSRVCKIIDQAIERIKNLISSGFYSEIMFSKDSDRETLGTGIFNPCDDVKNYIYEKLIGINQFGGITS